MHAGTGWTDLIDPQNSANPTSAGNGMPLKILAVHRYYWPDTPPYAAILHGIALRWVRDGHEVDILSGQPSYKTALANAKRPKAEHVNGVNIRRVDLPREAGRPAIRVLNAIRLGVALLRQSLKTRPDIIMISTVPPVLGGFFAALAARLVGARFVYHCMDIHPEIGKISGEFRNPLLFRFLRAIDSQTCKSASRVIVLSSDMEAAIRRRAGLDHCPISIINNFALPGESEGRDRAPFNADASLLTVLFAGNIGRFQSLGTVVRAMSRLQHRNDIRFILMGDGSEKQSLESLAEELGARLTFIGHQSSSAAKAAMAIADLGYISLEPDVYRYAYPSKAMTYLEQGCPLLVAMEPDSALAKLVINSRAGFTVEPENDQELAKLLESLAEDKSWRTEQRLSAKRTSDECFAKSPTLDKWSALVRELMEATP